MKCIEIPSSHTLKGPRSREGFFAWAAAHGEAMLEALKGVGVAPLPRCFLAGMAVVATIVGVPGSSVGQTGSTCVEAPAELSRTIVQIIDAETLRLDDGQDLRLVDILTPRAVEVGITPGDWAPEAQATIALEQLVLAKSVEIAFPGASDRYGRMLAHVFVVEGSQRHWVQEELVARGHARVYAGASDLTCALALLVAENNAREARRGLWSEAAYQVRRATGREADLYRGSFQILQGRIARAINTRGTIYLNFDRYRRTGFTAFVRVRDKDLLGAYAQDPNKLAGREVRVRGWIEGRRGPAINLSAAGLFEVINEAPTPAGRTRAQ